LADEEEAFFGWRIDGLDKLSLRAVEGQPTRLAVEMHSAWRALLAERGLQRLKSDVRQIEMVDQWIEATAAHVVRVLCVMWEYPRPRATELVEGVMNAGGDAIANVDLFWQLGGDLRATLELEVMSDHPIKSKYGNPTSPWACIANLDEMTLEIYCFACSARPIDAAGLGRYCAELGSISFADGRTAYRLVLLASLPNASDLPSNWAECAELAGEMLAHVEIPKNSSAHARLKAAHFVDTYGLPEVARILHERAVATVSN
jgi:hypothetical protein